MDDREPPSEPGFMGAQPAAPGTRRQQRRVVGVLSWAPAYAAVFLASFFLSGTLGMRPHLDPSWQVVLEYALSHGLRFGRDIVFSYGPLGLLGAPVGTGEFVWLRTLSALAWSALLAWAIVGIVRRLPILFRPTLLVWAIFALLTLPRLYVGAPILLATVAGLLMFGERGHRISSTIGLTAVAALSLMKFTHLFMGLAAILCVVFVQLGRRAHGEALRIAVGYCALVLMGWLATGQHITDFGPWFLGGLEISRGYSEAMARPLTPAVRNLGVTSALVFVLLLINLRHVRPLVAARTAFLGLLALYAFVSWKHSFVRAEEHALEFFLLIPLLAHVAIEHSEPERSTKRRLILRALPVFTLCLLCLRGTELVLHEPVSKLYDDARQSTQRNLSQLGHVAAGTWRANYSDTVARISDTSPYFPRGTPSLVGDDTIDCLNYRQCAVIGSDLNYHPRPVFQSYTAFTPALQRWNLEHYRSERRPRWVLLRIESIDNRYPMLDDPLVLTELLRSYEFVNAEAQYLLLRYRGISPKLSLELLHEQEFEPGESIDLRRWQRFPLILQFDVDPTLWSRVVTALYQAPEMRMVITIDEQQETYRFIPALAKVGFIANPKVTVNGEFRRFLQGDLSRVIDTVKIRARRGGNPRRWFRSIRIRVYRARGLPGDPATDP